MDGMKIVRERCSLLWCAPLSPVLKILLLIRGISMFRIITISLVLAAFPLCSIQCSKNKADKNDTLPIVSEKQKSQNDLHIYNPGAEPDGIDPKLSTDVTFTVLLTGAQVPPAKVQLEQVDKEGNVISLLGDLMDDGTNGDIELGDGIYSGIFQIRSETVGILYYRTRASYEGRDYISENCSLTVTTFPVGPAPSDAEFLVIDPNTNEKLYSNELLVAFVEGTSAARIRQITVAEEVVVIGTLPSLGVFQLRIPGDGMAADVYKAIKAFQAYKEVEYAEPNYAAELDNEL